jgi:hypothetical protein
MEWSTVSKALAKSITISAQYCLESRAMVKSLRTFKVAVTHPQPDGKPDYIPERML